ncbi:major tail protein [Lactococcus nasutitermitis]|uniref:Major tail protein n=1 Tax=Lactococcus nasutitermitis TaxID=1652957 RepID=A0ABV9JEB1_9LACT|nr:major tail protein [Lactococcus nasutitermitis]
MATAAVGFEKITLRVLDGKEATLGENEFEVYGKTNEGATSSAKISGLAVEPVKTWGSNKVYNISGKGVGDGKIDIDIIDLPDKVLSQILGYKMDEDGVIIVDSEVQAPACSILIEDSDIRGNKYMLGFFSGVFSYDGIELDTAQGKATEIKADTVSFAIGSNDAGQYMTKYSGDDTTAQNAVRSSLQLSVGTPQQVSAPQTQPQVQPQAPSTPAPTQSEPTEDTEG